MQLSYLLFRKSQSINKIFKYFEITVVKDVIEKISSNGLFEIIILREFTGDGTKTWPGSLIWH